MRGSIAEEPQPDISESAKAAYVRWSLYAGRAILLLLLYLGGADLYHRPEDLTDCVPPMVYLFAMAGGSWLLVQIRKDPGIAGCERLPNITSVAENYLADELDRGRYTEFKFYPKTRVYELKQTLVDPGESEPGDPNSYSARGTGLRQASFLPQNTAQDLRECRVRSPHESLDNHRSVETSKGVQDDVLIHSHPFTGNLELMETRREVSSQQEPEMVRSTPLMHYCQKCNLVQSFRTRHCHQCRACIAKYDHHCFWSGRLLPTEGAASASATTESTGACCSACPWSTS